MTTAKRTNKLIMLVFGLLAAGLMLFASPLMAYASQPFNPPIPTNQPASPQQRFNWAYTNITLKPCNNFEAMI